MGSNSQIAALEVGAKMRLMQMRSVSWTHSEILDLIGDWYYYRGLQ